jgi:radical SAM protein with 4Fe4S-binding SPASM domain
MDAFYVSIDGSNAHINDAGRGEGSFDDAMAGLVTCLELRGTHGVKVAINYTVTSKNYSDLLSIARLGASLGVDEVFINLSVFVTEAEGRAGSEVLARELGMRFDSWRGFLIDPVIASVDAEALAAQLEELARTSWPMSVFVQPVGYTPLELRSYFTAAWPAQLKEKACPVQSFRTTVLPNGDVSPCTLYHDVVLGNLGTATLNEIWYGDAYRRFRELVTARLLPTCARCCDLLDETKGDPMSFVNDSRLKHRVG